ncbi:N-acylneuraminate cytidylyltransferase [Paraglaciecola mesophila]|uniref:N-acylneuraminate cytidylyltransferase n=1 Tax=Paraglaciecola mesophila TaxID=197222 RepID=A0A857JMZ4_9ALTE|nr:acylneuraminate cytidylyltransferase family protein [Paraglaciecola mesophila]QHJ13435.1 N-acylneuraminate cytidylyltransferase [Paraglaciecola mesophila]
MLAIIPARGGSKGLPKKNIKPLLGKPLIAHTIEQALKSHSISKVVVSTDDRNIYEAGLTYGAEDTFLRPSALATDDAHAIDNYLYTLNRLEREFHYDVSNFIVLQPTSPLRDSHDIDSAIELFFRKKADSVVSYTEEDHPISWHKYIKEDGSFENLFSENIANRQNNQSTYYPNGAIFVFKRELIEKREYYSSNSFAYVMDRKSSVDIDSIDDFEYAEYLMRKRSE